MLKLVVAPNRQIGQYWCSQMGLNKNEVRLITHINQSLDGYIPGQLYTYVCDEPFGYPERHESVDYMEYNFLCRKVERHFGRVFLPCILPTLERNMSDKIAYNTVGTIEVKADLYHDDPNHRYLEGSFDGDMSSDTFDSWELDAARFPAGTIITFNVPDCPECGEDAENQHDDKKCPCGFDWGEWVENKYS